jgi:protein ImuB
MNYAVLWAEHFALQALRRTDPALAQAPVALLRGEGRHAVAAEVSPEAGLPAGLPASLALARCPGLLLRPRDPAAETEAQSLLIAAAFTLAPRVEATAPGCCTVDLRGADAAALERNLRLLILELAGAGLAVRSGAAATPLLALYAARRAEPVLLVARAADFLAPLPLDFAEPQPAQAEVLGQWGIHALGQLTALSKAEIGRRLGPEGIALWERAAGQTERLLRLVEPGRTFAVEWAYEPPVEAIEPLFFRLRRFAERVAFELRAAGLAAAALTLTLLLEDESDYRRTFTLPEPNTDVDGWLRVLQAHLEGVRTAARVAGVRFAAAPARAREKQDGLFDTGLRDPQAFWESLARVGAIVGEGRVGTPRPADSHRPGAFALEKPAPAVPPAAEPPVHPPRGLVPRRFRPPWPVRVAWTEGRLAAVEGPELQDAIREAHGPWRASGDWWRPEAWARETWQVELAGGGIYELAREGESWSVTGIFD